MRGGVQQQVDQVVVQQVDLVDVEHAAVRGGQQARLEGLHALGQRPLDVERADEPVLGGADRQLDQPRRAGRAPAPGVVRPVRAGRVGRGRVAGEAAAGDDVDRRAAAPASARTAVDLAVPFSPRTSTPPTAGRDGVEQQREPQVVHPDDGGEGVRGVHAASWVERSLRRWSSRTARLGPVDGVLTAPPGGRTGSPAGAPGSISRSSASGVGVLLDQVAQPVQLLLAQRARRWCPGAGTKRRPAAAATSAQEGPAEAVALQRAVPVRAPDRADPAAVQASALVPPPPALRRRRGGSRSPRPARRAPSPTGRARVLSRGEADPHGQQPEPVDRARAATRPRPRSLGRASGSRRRCRAPGGPRRPARSDRVGQAALAQPLQARDRAAGAGQHHEVGVGQLLRPVDEAHDDARLGGQRVHVGEVRHQRHRAHGDPQHVLAVRRRAPTPRTAPRSETRSPSSSSMPRPCRERQHAVASAGR